MGWQNIFAVIFSAGNRIVLNPSGFFVYNGPPALGNLVASITPSAGTDPYGNVYEADSTVYGPNGSYVNTTSTGGTFGGPAILFNEQGASHVSLLTQIVANIANGGTAKEQEVIVITSGKAGGDDMALEFFSESFDGTIQATGIIEAGGTTLITINKTNVTFTTPIVANGGSIGNPTNITSDSWHQATAFNNGWTAAGAGFWYRMTNDKELEIMGDLLGGPAGNSGIINFTGVYIPNLSQNHPCGQNDPGGTSPPWINIGGTGTLSAIGVPVAGEEIFFHVFIPLNLSNGGFG